MADGAKPVVGGCPPHTIYIWPSQPLIARSWHWPESWHPAFEQAASQLGRLVAVCILGGLPVSQQPITMELPTGCVGFSVRCLGTSIFIAVSDFEGPEGPAPDAPGPKGGARAQPVCANGLILGLRGSGKSFTIVTFYGSLPPIPAGRAPAGNIMAPQVPAAFVPVGRNGCDGRTPGFAASIAVAAAVPRRCEIAAQVNGEKWKHRRNDLAKSQLLLGVGPYGTAAKLGIRASTKLCSGWVDAAHQPARRNLPPFGRLNRQSACVPSLPSDGMASSSHSLPLGKPPSHASAGLRLRDAGFFRRAESGADAVARPGA